MRRYILAIAVLLFVCTSCEQYIGGDINADPDKPNEVPVQSMMPSIMLSVIDMYGSDFSLYNSWITQHNDAIARCWAAFNISGAEFDKVWENLYATILCEARSAKDQAQEEGLLNHYAVFNILEAFTLLTATDVWDAIPYTEACDYHSYPDPKYDPQSELYDRVFALLEEAEEMMSPSALDIGDVDLIYHGDLDRWRSTIHAIKARALLQIGDYAAATMEAEGSYTSSDADLEFAYPGDDSSAAPWYRFNRDRTGDSYLHYHFKNILKSYKDTLRLNLWDHTYNIQHPYLTSDMAVELLTYREMQFIIAESSFRLGDYDRAYDAYVRAIASGASELGADDIPNPAVLVGADNLSLKDILMQKYISLFLNPVTYNDWRRTKVPDLDPPIGRYIQTRWRYPRSEYRFNSSAPEESDVDIYLDHVWWNK